LMRKPRTTPDFLYAALDRSAYAAFFTESCMRLIDSTKLHRKSGYVLGYFQPSLAGLSPALKSTQDCILGYSQPSLRD
jgi:hypothetical protein